MTAPESGVTPMIAAALATRTPVLWLNADRTSDIREIDARGFDAAQDRLSRAHRLFKTLFPELGTASAAIESPLIAAPRLGRALMLPESSGHVFIKADHLLPIAGSIKARGGFNEVLNLAESLAVDAGLLKPGGDLEVMASTEAREMFARHCVAVGSTGNLGMSIGTLASALGFQTEVHMSRDAKTWKKQELRRRGAHVVEHKGDYIEAVAAGRRAALNDPSKYFVDDENSRLLLEGYAAAAEPLARQLEAEDRTPSAERPLFVYLPCGVGGAPGGITLGLSRLFGADVHCFFAEPVSCPSMLLAMASGGDANVSVYDYGLDNRTEADGLAVPRASGVISHLIRPWLSGVFTVTDEQLFAGLLSAWNCEGLEIEPSAAAGFAGPRWLLNSDAGALYREKFDLDKRLDDSTHVLWTTGGSLMPAEEHARCRAQAEEFQRIGLPC